MGGCVVERRDRRNVRTFGASWTEGPVDPGVPEPSIGVSRQEARGVFGAGDLEIVARAQGYSSPENRSQADWRVMPSASPIRAQLTPRSLSAATWRLTARSTFWWAP